MALAAEPAPQEHAEPPRPSSLVESTERRLVQIDVGVRGSPEVIADLKREDFRLVVGVRKIHDFVLDNLCAPAASDPREVALEVGDEAAHQARPHLARPPARTSCSISTSTT
jgi:hypothetical protein